MSGILATGALAVPMARADPATVRRASDDRLGDEDGDAGVMLPVATADLPGTSPFIVRAADGADVDVLAAHLAADGASVTTLFRTGFRGASVSATPGVVAVLRADPDVVSVEADSVRRLTGAAGLDAAEALQTPAPWSLDRLDQRALPLSGTYDPVATGAGVQVYVLDTGVRADHVEFGGRVLAGAYLDDGKGSADCNGHGTHVAGIVGSATYGVAKQVALIPVRVLGCDGSGTDSGIIAGMNWIIGNHQAGVPAVMNMSVGGPADRDIDAALQAVIDDGITVTVSAGNSAADACAESPGRVPAALTVGASDVNDSVASFSNVGSCVDLFAPGVGVVSTWNDSPTATKTLMGTSMASPHVAGAAAVLLSQQPTLSPAEVSAALIADATTGVLTNARAGSPNRLLHVTPAAPVAPPAPSSTTSFVPVVPARFLDSRGDGLTVDGVGAGGGVLGAGSVTRLQVAGRGGVPVDASAVVLNVTVAQAQGAGFVVVFPCGSDRPSGSNVNYVVGATVANAVVAKVGVGGAVCVFTYAATDLIVDVNGWFPAGASFVPVVPARFLDSRGDGLTVDGVGAGGGVLGAGSVTRLQVAGRGGVPVDASAVVLNVTVAQAQGAGFVVVFPCGSDRPSGSNVNYVVGATVANAVVAKVGVGGAVCVFTYAATDLIVDVNGWFPAGASFVPVVPARFLDSRGDGLTVDGVGAGGGVLGAGSVTRLQVAGRGGVPVDASAVVLNVTVAQAQGAGFVVVFPCGSDRPSGSNVNYVVGATVANAVVAKVGVGGAVCVFTYAATDLIVDVNGWFPAG